MKSSKGTKSGFYIFLATSEISAKDLCMFSSTNNIRLPYYLMTFNEFRKGYKLEYLDLR